MPHQESNWPILDRVSRRYQINELTGCWEWTGYKTNGYGRIKYLGKNWRPHRLVFFMLNPDADQSMMVCHKCDNPSCINPEHLFLGTAKDNSQDCIEKGRTYWQNKPSKAQLASRGERNPSAKLTEKDVLEIRAVPSLELNTAELSEKYGVGARLISDIRSRKRWKHI